MDFKLQKDFYERRPEIVARELLGKLIISRSKDKIKLAKITETEAYLAKNDTASHANHGQTKRNKPMFGAAGTVYVYFTYGMHWLFNIVTEKRGIPSAVLIRSVEPIFDSEQEIEKLSFKEKHKLGAGPARLTNWLGINISQNRLPINNNNYLGIVSGYKIGDIIFNAEVVKEYVTAQRVGIETSSDKDKELRFYIKGNRFVSKII